MPESTPLTHVTATPEQAGFRADRALCVLVPALTRRAAKTLFQAAAIKLNGKAARGSERIEAGDRLEYPDPEAPAGRELLSHAKAPRLTTSHGRQVLRLYEDDAVLVIGKPAEIPVHRNQDGINLRETLEDVLEKAYPPYVLPDAAATQGRAVRVVHGAGGDADEDEDTEPQLAGAGRAIPGFFFCHRLDMETTGCLLVAKTPETRDALIRDFEHRRIGKTYLAVAAGDVPWEHLVVRRPIKYQRKEMHAEPHAPGPRRGRGGVPAWVSRKKSRKPVRSLKVGVALEPGAEEGKACETAFTVLRRYKGYTLLKCEPKTGRMHQIRVHLAAEGHPLAYDQLYGRRSPLRLREFDPSTDEDDSGETIVLNRLPLHAWKLAFQHPVTRAKVDFEAPLPGDLKEFLRILKKFRGK